MYSLSILSLPTSFHPQPILISVPLMSILLYHSCTLFCFNEDFLCCERYLLSCFSQQLQTWRIWRSCGGWGQDCSLLECDTVWFGTWVSVLTPWSWRLQVPVKWLHLCTKQRGITSHLVPLVHLLMLCICHRIITSLASKPRVNSFLLSVMHLVMIPAWRSMAVARSCAVELRYGGLQIDCVTCCSKQCAFFWLLLRLHREYKVWHIIPQLAHSCVYVNWGALVYGW